jgi:hydroxyethylthiazole kinase-like uncharacterized protein yjeF
MNQIESFLSRFHHPYTLFDHSKAITLYKPRDPFAHKGNFGHALLMAGSYGKMGAAVLAAKACLTSGAGLLSTWIPACGYEIMQTALPEAMVRTDDEEFHITNYPADLDMFQAAGIGPGIGMNDETATMLTALLPNFRKPLVLDADALNIISKSPDLLNSVHPHTILTPHPKEFDRLFGESSDDISRFEKAKKISVQHQVIIVLKGHFTGIFYPDGNISFNTSGNAGMAKGGSGDALTGIITAFLAQSLAPASAAGLGVYLHGYAGDLAAALYSEEAMLASDLINCLGKSFIEWKSGIRNN